MHVQDSVFWLGVASWRKEMLYFLTHSTHFIYGYLVSDIWWKAIHIVREETRYHYFMGYSFWLAAKDFLYAPSQRQHSIYHILHQLWSTGWNKKNNSECQSWGIDPMTHGTMSYYGSTIATDQITECWKCDDITLVFSPAFYSQFIFWMYFKQIAW